jgi:hypothetical protein
VPNWLKTVLFIRKNALLDKNNKNIVQCDYSQSLMKSSSHKKNNYVSESVDFTALLGNKVNKSIGNIQASKFGITNEDRSQSIKSINAHSYNTTSRLDINGLDKMIKSMRRMLKIQENNEKNKKDTDDCLDEWKEVSRRLDIFMFIVTICVVILVPIFLFGKFIFAEDITKIPRVGKSCGCGMK